MIICSLLTACGQTTSVSRDNNVDSVSDIVISVSDNEVSLDIEEKPEEMTADTLFLKDYYSDWREAYLDCMDYIIWLYCEEMANKFWI